jgi:AcrR family transcriptional regulator
MEEKVLRVAFKLYADKGWAGFSYTEIARRAGVGKAALLLRWPEKTSLLIASLEAAQLPIIDIDTGAIRTDLLELAELMYRLITSPDGMAFFRLRVEARSFSELHAALEVRASARSVMDARQIVRRAIARGELPAGTSAALLTDLVVGAIVNHVLATPRQLSAAVHSRAGEYAAAVVDAALIGAAALADVPSAGIPDRRDG